MKDIIIKTKKVKTVNEKTLIVTMDISKIVNTGYCRCPDGTEVEPFEFSNNGRGFNKLWECITQTMRTHKLEQMVVGFESTGPYAEPLLHYLRKRKVKVVQVNPMHTKKLKELHGNSPNKTDQKDPRVIADIIALGHALTVIVPEGTAAELRRLTHARERSIQRRTALLNQLQDLLFVIFPEFIQVIKNIKSKSAKYILGNYTTPQEIIETGIEPLSFMLRKISRGRFGREEAESLYKAAINSVGIEEGQESIVLEIRECLRCIEASDQFIDEVKNRMSNYLKEIPYSSYILSLKGIGEITTAGLIGELGDFRKYRTISEVIKLAGLDLYEISSGKHKGEKHISKRGRPLMRKLLYFASMNVVKKGGALHKEYQIHLQKGMPKIKALIAISRKLIGIIFALVRDHSMYIENYSKKPYPLKEAA